MSSISGRKREKRPRVERRVLVRPIRRIIETRMIQAIESAMAGEDSAATMTKLDSLKKLAMLVKGSVASNGTGESMIGR